MVRRSNYDDTTANRLSLGDTGFTSPGRSPGLEAAKGVTTSIRRGRSIGEESAKGAPLAVHRAKGGHTRAHKQIYSLYKMLHSHFAGHKRANLADTLRGSHRNPRGR